MFFWPLFFSGLHWHLPGLSELPLEQRLFLLRTGQPFSLFIFYKFVFQFLFCGPFFICTSMLSSSINRNHSTAQSTLHKATKQVRADRNATTQASRQSCESREPTCRRAFTQLPTFSKRTNKQKKLRPTQIYNHLQSSFSLCDARRTCLHFQTQ